MRSALSARAQEAAITVVDSLAFETPKTREMVGFLTALGVEKGALIVLSERDESVVRTSANVPGVRAITPVGLCLLDILNYPRLILTPESVEAITKSLLDVKASSEGEAAHAES